MNEEILAKARAAKSPEELLNVMRGIGEEDFSEEAAKMYFNFLHKSGELSDDELESAAGGCKVSGHTTVTCNHECHCGQYSPFYRADHKSLRDTWETFTHVENPHYVNKCGYCGHLGFTNGGTGYCEID